MLLSELQDLRADTIDKVVANLLASNRFKSKLGEGSFGMAFKTQDGKVLKCWFNDPGYEAYIKYCNKNPQDPWLLKTYGKIREITIRIPNAPKKVKVCKVEFLNNVTMTVLDAYDPPKIIDEHNDADNEIDVNDFCEIIDAAFKDHMTYDNVLAGFSDIATEPLSAKFTNLVKEIYDHLDDLRQDGMKIDFGKRNIGARGKQIVLLDPLYDKDGVGGHTTEIFDVRQATRK